jgi:uncharacterized membrane protein
LNRFYSIDVLRGMIMIIMALDHVIAGISFQHPQEIVLHFSLPNGKDMADFPGYGSPTEQWSRLATHVCAPGFQLLAGMGLAISVARSRQRRVPEGQITRDLAVRGLVLILIEWFILCPFAYQAQFLFLGLCCIGTCTLCFMALRFLPKHLIGLLGLAIIAFAPWYAASEVKPASDNLYLLYIWRDVAIGNRGWFVVMYPVLPWLGCFALGWWIGLELNERQDEASVKRQSARLIVSGLALFFLGFALRWSGLPFAERVALNGATPSDLWFWQFAKYPPSLVFLLLTLGVLLTALGVLRPIDLRERVPAWCRAVAVYGRTALFFFVVHFLLIGIIQFYMGLAASQPFDIKTRYSFPVAYAVWICLVLLLWPVCKGYDNLRQQYRSSLRYF